MTCHNRSFIASWGRWLRTVVLVSAMHSCGCQIVNRQTSSLCDGDFVSCGFVEDVALDHKVSSTSLQGETSFESQSRDTKGARCCLEIKS